MMRRMNLLIPLPALIAMVLAATLLTGCLLDSGEPKKIEPGSRNYTWEVDTLDNGPFGSISDLWGASPHDLWAVTWGGDHGLWHYDGKKWKPDSSNIVYSSNCIFGLSTDNIWAGGIDGNIFHYNGKQWERTYQFATGEYHIREIKSINGDSPFNLYASGTVVPKDDTGPFSRGLLLHYNGKQWEKVFVTPFGMQFNKVWGKQSEVYIEGTRLARHSFANADSVFLFKYEPSSGEQRTIRASTRSKVSSINLNKINGEIAQFVDDSLKIGHSLGIRVDPSFKAYGSFGRTPKDVFINSYTGLIHYNGSNFAYLLRIPEDMPGGVWRTMVFPDDIFFNVQANGTNYIYHGIKAPSD